MLNGVTLVKLPSKVWRTDRKGKALPEYEVYLDGVFIGRVEKHDTPCYHKPKGCRYTTRTTYSVDWWAYAGEEVYRFNYSRKVAIQRLVDKRNLEMRKMNPNHMPYNSLRDDEEKVRSFAYEMLEALERIACGNPGTPGKWLTDIEMAEIARNVLVKIEG